MTSGLNYHIQFQQQSRDTHQCSIVPSSAKCFVSGSDIETHINVVDHTSCIEGGDRNTTTKRLVNGSMVIESSTPTTPCFGRNVHLILLALREGIAAYFYALVVYSAAVTWSTWYSIISRGVAYFVMSLLFGGAIINPIMALALLLSRTCTFKVFIVTIISQLALGYVLAAVTVKYGLGIDIIHSVPLVVSGSISIGFVAEFLGTTMCCLCVVASSSVEAWEVRSLLTGVMLFVAGIAMEDASKSCFNPWFALAASLFSYFDSLAWIYYVAPIVGCVLAVGLAHLMGLQKFCNKLHCISSSHN